MLTAARLLRESKAGQWKNVLVAKARGFLEIVVRFSSEFFSLRAQFFSFSARFTCVDGR